MVERLSGVPDIVGSGQNWPLADPTLKPFKNQPLLFCIFF